MYVMVHKFPTAMLLKHDGGDDDDDDDFGVVHYGAAEEAV